MKTPLLTWLLRLVVMCVVGFLLLPAVVVFIAGFNDRAILSFPPQSFSLRWFERALTYPDFRHGLRNALIVMVWTSTISIVVGAAFAYALNRYEFRLKHTLEAILMSPLMIPHFTIGLGLLMLGTQMGFARTFGIVVFSHIVIVLPFVIRSVYISMQNLDPRLEKAATSLGAPPWRVLVTIVLPLLAPGLFSGWLFAAILSFNEFTGSLFVTSQATQTLPVAMYNYVREYADPTLAALSTIYIVITATLLTIANLYLGLGKVLNVEQSR